MPFHWTPFLILMFVLIFPTTISYMLLPVGLKYLKTTVVAIYGYLILIVATITSLALGQDRFSWTQTFAIILSVLEFTWLKWPKVKKSKEKGIPSRNAFHYFIIMFYREELIACAMDLNSSSDNFSFGFENNISDSF